MLVPSHCSWPDRGRHCVTGTAVQGVAMLAGYWWLTRGDTFLRWDCRRKCRRRGQAKVLPYDIIGAGTEARAMFGMTEQVRLRLAQWQS